MALRLIREGILVFRKAILLTKLFSQLTNMTFTLTDGDKLLTEGDDEFLLLAPISADFLLTFCPPAHHTRGAIV